jgi:hypothetical protein
MSEFKKKIAKKELEKLYDNRFKWLQAGKLLHGRLYDKLEQNPKLTTILSLCIIANIGIWSTLFLVMPF